MSSYKEVKFSIFLFVLLLVLAGIHSNTVYAQSNKVAASKERYFGGSVGATNNGISLLPTVALHEPAGFLKLNMGKRFTFEPEFHFSLEGKPWIVVLWARYKLLGSEKFKFSVGANPGILFTSGKILVNGLEDDGITAQRYVGSDFSPDYFITKNTSIGIYYLRTIGFAESALKNLHFLTVNTNFQKIDLNASYYLRLHPQLYYLKMDDLDGFYATSTLGLEKNNFPVLIQVLANKSIRTKIPDSSKFLWSLSITYSFGRGYVQSPHIFQH